MRAKTGERGGMLLELIIVVTAAAAVLVAVLGGFGSKVLMTEHNQQGLARAAARDYAKAIQNMATTGGYVPCADPEVYASPPGYSPPSGFKKSIVPGSMQYWDGLGWQTACPADTGSQRLTVRVVSSDGKVSEEAEAVLRLP